MIADVKVKDVMKKELIVLHPKDTIQNVEQKFQRYQIRHIPITVNRKLVGIVSLGDLLITNKLTTSNADKFLATDFITSSAVEDIMTHNPIFVGEEDSIKRALDIMMKKRFNCLPVVTAGELVGILTTFDIINLLNKNIEAPCVK